MSTGVPFNARSTIRVSEAERSLAKRFDTPIAADLVVKAVDEKLYTIGAALDDDPLGELLIPQPSGFLQSFASHPLPYVFEGGCGGTGGGREDFRDLATFQHVRTGADGVATVSFHLPDDLTTQARAESPRSHRRSRRATPRRTSPLSSA